MKKPIPAIVAAFYLPDPTIGGYIESLKQERIEAMVVSNEQWPRDWVPNWVPDPERVTYYVVAQWRHEAAVVSHMRSATVELMSRKHLVLHPPHRFLWFSWY